MYCYRLSEDRGLLVQNGGVRDGENYRVVYHYSCYLVGRVAPRELTLKDSSLAMWSYILAQESLGYNANQERVLYFQCLF